MNQSTILPYLNLFFNLALLYRRVASNHSHSYSFLKYIQNHIDLLFLVHDIGRKTLATSSFFESFVYI